MNRLLSIVIALGLTTLFAGCASSPPYNEKLDEARSAYLAIEQDPDVARSGASQLRSARTELDKAEALLEEDADVAEIEHASYLALRHAEIAQQQGLRAALEDDVASAEERRNQIMLDMKTQEAADLRAQMAAMQAERTERGMVLTLGDVLFDVGKADLKPSAQRTIDQLAQFMKQYEERRVRVEGYTDSTGDEGFNQRLSEQRAMSVYDALLSEGISSSRVEVEGYGEAYPVASNDTSAGRQENRRVEIVISDESGNIKGR
ncbi:OmpA family protein [Marinobacter salinisoli]|uniref:OmpA family protein n=1 Tax=Marinobacter salinisoli TaxID=2769486 RepID=A0ABX7MPD4_9GAMM|nr:OmpA family protein [Marinobacter salinisoli]QSP94176.1 OmpA family protein [Marinobacter salinisoli]